MIVKHYKGKHYPNLHATLLSMYASLRNRELEIKFTEDTKFTLDVIDQADRNKIYGRVAFKYKGKERQYEEWSSWGYLNNEFTISNYSRVDGKMIFGEKTIVPINTWFTIPKPNFISWFPVGVYFGGNDSDSNGIGGTPQKDLQYELRFKKC